MPSPLRWAPGHFPGISDILLPQGLCIALPCLAAEVHMSHDVHVSAHSPPQRGLPRAPHLRQPRPSAPPAFSIFLHSSQASLIFVSSFLGCLPYLSLSPLRAGQRDSAQGADLICHLDSLPISSSPSSIFWKAKQPCTCVWPFGVYNILPVLGQSPWELYLRWRFLDLVSCGRAHRMEGERERASDGVGKEPGKGASS